MEEDRLIQLVCTPAEYAQFKTLYDGFCYLMDYKGERDSNYFYEQKKVFGNIIKCWSLIEKLCSELNVELKINSDDFNKIIFGFDRKAIAQLYASDRYQDIAVDKIMGLEEERLKKAGVSLFHDIMIKIDNAFQNESQVQQKDFGYLDYVLPIKDEEMTNEQVVELLGGGISKGTITKWVKSGLLKDNGLSGRQHRVMKSSVLLLKTNREKQREIGCALEKYRIDNAKR